MPSKNLTAADLHDSVPPNWYHQSICDNALQRYWHKRRFEEVGKLIEKVDGKVLDIGSADGVFTKVLVDKTKANKVIGIDVLRPSVAWANKHWRGNKKMVFKVGDAHNLPFKDEMFNAVFALEVLEHVFEPLKALREIKRVLKHDGYGVFLVPAENTLFKIVWFLWGFYRGKIWKGTHLHKYEGKHLIEFCKRVGLKIEIEKKFMLGMLLAIKVRKV